MRDIALISRDGCSVDLNMEIMRNNILKFDSAIVGRILLKSLPLLFWLYRLNVNRVGLENFKSQ